jgi:hypothetical protein
VPVQEPLTLATVSSSSLSMTNATVACALGGTNRFQYVTVANYGTNTIYLRPAGSTNNVVAIAATSDRTFETPSNKYQTLADLEVIGIVATAGEVRIMWGY